MQTATIQPEASQNSNLINQSWNTGTTRNYGPSALVYDSNGRLIVDPTIDDTPTNICNVGLYQKAQLPPDNVAISISYNGDVNPKRNSAHAVTEVLSGQGSDPLESDFGSIKWSLAVTVDTTNPLAPKVSIAGTHTCYPAREVYVNGTLIWQYGPGNHPLGLSGSTDIAYEDTDGVYIVGCLSGASSQIPVLSFKILNP